MADPDEKKEDIPAFKISEKKVDDSWKEEARREREAAAKAAVTLSKPPAPAAPAAAAAPSAAGTPAAPEKGEADEPLSKEKALEQQHTKIFLNFIEGLAQQALMQLGEMENPYTGQTEMDLQGARYTIELLSVIMAKTKGNLNETEQKALSGILHDLRTHFTAIATEVQRQMQAQAARGAKRPGPGGTVG